jgi:hypothetical protein
MAFPLIPAAVAGLGKLGIGAKLASAFGAAKGLVAGKAATQLAIPGLTGAAKSGLGGLGSRMAGTTFIKNASALMPKTAAEWGMRVAPDAIFGTIAGAMTPGDFGDKLIAGTTATAGGALGGLALRGAVGGVAPGLMKNTVADITSEMVGGIGGDIAAQGVADGLLRVKGGGTTPYEKMAAQEQRALEQRILSQYLSGKGGYPNSDPFLAANGLG